MLISDCLDSNVRLEGYEIGYLNDYLIAFIYWPKSILRTMFVNFGSYFGKSDLYVFHFFFLSFYDYRSEKSEIESSDSDSFFDVVL